MLRSSLPTSRDVVSAVCLGALVLCLGRVVDGDEPDPLAVFEQRIMPVFNSPEPSSCVQCHLSSVDLKDYILPSSRATFLSLFAQDLIDENAPSDSKILTLIGMGDLDEDPMANRLHKRVREQEYDAFAAWIVACCSDATLMAEARGAVESGEVPEQAGPKFSDAVIRHNRKDRVLDSFTRNIWSQRMRCFPCHTPDELDSNNPMHSKPIERHRDFVKQYGQRMNIFKATPAATLRALVASSSKAGESALPLIDSEQPMQSLLLLKPTAKLPPKVDGVMAKPSSLPPVSHMGGIKMHKDDHSYKAFAAWLQDYAKAQSGDYASEDELPHDDWIPTEYVIRVRNVPTEWKVMSTVQLFLHRWDHESDDWEEDPCAFTQSKITPRRIVNGTLFLLGNSDKHNGASSTKSANELADGRFQVRLMIDRENRIHNEPALMLNAVIVESDSDEQTACDAVFDMEAKWKAGFKNATVIDASESE